MTLRILLNTLLLCVLGSPVWASGITVVLPEDEAAYTGRLVVYVVRDGVTRADPAEGFVERNPQPIYGLSITNEPPGSRVRFSAESKAYFFGAPPWELPPGKYRAQAVLDRHRQGSAWQNEPGNLYSAPVRFEVRKDATADVELKLDQVVVAEEPTTKEGVAELFEMESALLSEFYGRPFKMRAGVGFPREYDPSRRYPAVYEVPGFGGTWRDGLSRAMRPARGTAQSPGAQLGRSVFWIMLDCESPNGPTMFADSPSNGPWGRALIEEFIPAIERRFNLIAEPSARLLRGHSTGGWSTLWLITEYPDFFGASWSTSPDPVDFRHFETADIYADENMYHAADQSPRPAARFRGRVTMTIAQENGMEQALGENNDSAGQWDSWQAVYGSRAPDGNPAALFHAITGEIDRAEAERYRAKDIADRLRSDPMRFGPIFRDKVVLVVGDADEYYLDRAVVSLKTELESLGFATSKPGQFGSVTVVPGATHGSVYGSAAVRTFPEQMLRWLSEHGHLPASKP